MREIERSDTVNLILEVLWPSDCTSLNLSRVRVLTSWKVKCSSHCALICVCIILNSNRGSYRWVEFPIEEIVFEGSPLKLIICTLESRPLLSKGLSRNRRENSAAVDIQLISTENSIFHSAFLPLLIYWLRWSIFNHRLLNNYRVLYVSWEALYWLYISSLPQMGMTALKCLTLVISASHSTESLSMDFSSISIF